MATIHGSSIVRTWFIDGIPLSTETMPVTISKLLTRDKKKEQILKIRGFLEIPHAVPKSAIEKSDLLFIPLNLMENPGQ